jgi:glycosyltransferase involved in cell wall biosynthesis
MRIGLDAKRLFNNSTGLGNYSRSVLKGLADYYPEHRYFLYTPKASLGLPEGLQGKAHMEIVKPEGLIYQSLHGLWRTFIINKLAMANQLDVYHGLSHELPSGIEKSGIRTIVTIHDLIFKHYPEYYAYADRMIYDRKFKSACERADAIIAISKATARDIMHYYQISPEKIHVIYQDCDEVFRMPSKSAVAERPYILSVSGTDARKNHLKLLEGFARYHQKYPEIQLVILGRDGDREKEISQYIYQKKLPVVRLRKVTHEELPAIYDGALFTVYPSVFEGFGIPMLESLRRGKPVIAHQEGCFSEAGGEAGLYTNVNDAAALAEAMISLTQDAALFNRLTAAIPRHLEQFEPKILAGQLMNIYSGNK